MDAIGPEVSHILLVEDCPKNNMKRTPAFPFVSVAACTLLLVAVAGCNNDRATQQPVAPVEEVPAAVPSTSPQSDLPGDIPAANGRKITVYSVAEDADGNRSLKPETVTLPGGSASTPALFALETLMNNAKSPIPEGTKLRSVKISESGTATVDFSGELRDNFPGGDSAEALLINAVISTLGQFKSVKSVQFLVDGKKIDTLGGGQTLDEPIPVPQQNGSAPIPAAATPPFAGTGER